MPRIMVLALFIISAPGLLAQETPWFPGSTYDSRIPTPKSVLGYEIGEYYTEHPEMTGYMRRLEASSDRVKVFHVGESNERRELILVVISDPENIKNLEQIRTSIEALRDPRRTSESRAHEIAGSTPAVAWMNYATDGNETAAFEAAIQLAYQLAAGQDATTMKILKEVVTVIDPALNPESHSRHVAWMKASAMGNPNPEAQEHRGDWRMDTNNNHYQIDINRDAAFQSQVESQVLVRELHRWNPVVFADHHGNPDRFFFPPWAIPVNTQLDANAKKWVNIYGGNIAAAFDKYGWTYFTRNVYDLHYPGYYDSYPTLNGATGMTFETDGGGNKGLAYRLPDGRITTLRDGTLHHFTASMSCLVTTAENREERLMDLYRFRADALREAAAEKVKSYVLVPGKDPTAAADLVALLLKHKIEVQRTRAPFESAAAHDYLTGDIVKKSFPSGVYVVSTAQPQKRLLRTLLDPETPLEPDFLNEVKEAKAYNDAVGDNAPKKRYGFYDINAWSLPMAFGVEAWWTESPASGSLEPVGSRPEFVWPSPARARFGYIFPWNSKGATRVVASLWKEGYRVALAREAFTIAGRDFPRGMVLVRTGNNPPTLHDRLSALAATNEVELFPIDSAFVEKGKDLGDRSVVDLEKPDIAVVSEPPTTVTAFGAVWFLLEKAYDIPFTAIKAQDLLASDLKRYNVIVLPDGRAGDYNRLFGEAGVTRLKDWVRDGGTLVCIKGATEWASGEKVGLTTARDKFAEPAKPAAEGDGKPVRRIDAVPGAFVRLDLDTEHYLAAGMDSPVVALFRSDIVYKPTEKGARVADIDADRPILAGFAFDEAREALKGGAYLWDEPTGRGHVTCFADDVSFRTFMYGAHRLLLNSILLGPSGRW